MIEASEIQASFDLKNMDKTDWHTYRFDQIAFNISERVEPQETGLEIYVGLEHIDPESIRIKRWGKPTDVDGTKLKVYPGDVIFGKRRAYQRKSALANFEGICSAHAMVLRPNPDVIESDLFPFFLHSDAFMHRAVDISVGSLSPTINWKTLAVQAFLIPPKEKQAKLAELLWAADTVVQSQLALTAKLKHVKSTYLSVQAGLVNTGITLGSVAHISYGMSVPPKSNPNGVSVIRATNIKRGEIVSNDLLIVNPNDVSPTKRVLLDEGDIIVVRSGAYTGDIGYVNSSWAGSLAGYDLVVKPDRNVINPIFVSEFLLSNSCQTYFKSESTRSAQPHLNAAQLKATVIPAIPIKQQEQFAQKLSCFSHSIDKVCQAYDSSLNTRSGLINQIFS